MIHEWWAKIYWIFRLGRKLLLILRQKDGQPLSGDEIYHSDNFDKYSRIGEMEKFRNANDGKFHFMLRYPELSSAKELLILDMP